MPVFTRVDPPWPLARWRTRQWLTEVRAADLAFSDDETQAFFARHARKPLSADLVDRLQRRTEGWVGGLQLVQLSLIRAEDPAQFVRGFSGSDRLIVDFLMDEVIEREPPPVLDFFAVTALLDRFCAPLCDTLLGSTRGSQPSRPLLEHLERENLFLVPLDDEQVWFRYHQLFKELVSSHLKVRLSPEREARLHRLAGEWFAGKALIEEALHHGLRAIQVVPKDHLYAYGSAVTYAAGAHATAGQWDKAFSLLADAISEDLAGGSRNAGRLLVAQAVLYSYAGDLSGVERSAKRIHYRVPLLRVECVCLGDDDR